MRFAGNPSVSHRRRVLSAAAALIAGAAVSACGSSASSHSSGSRSSSSESSSASTAAPASYVDQPVTFRAGGLTIHGIYRHPRAGGGGSRVPAVLLIAGSGPTDENGNSPEIQGPVDTLKTVADWLSADGVATLRYDKLGTGATGLGTYAMDVAGIGVAPFEQEAAAGLRFLAAQPGVDTARLGVFGHSEGALFALLAATGHSGGASVVPHVRALGLLEPLSLPELQIIDIQVSAQIATAVRMHSITPSKAARIRGALAAAIAEIRARGTVPAVLPAGLSTVLSPTSAHYLGQIDRDAPAALAATLPSGTSVLTSCSTSDVQVSCAEVARLDAGVRSGHATLDAVQLTGVDHVLKVDPSGSPADYGHTLPFSPQLRQAIAAFVKQAL